MNFWKLCKNGKLIKDKRGEYVDREDYDSLNYKYKKIKKAIDLKDIDYQLAHFVENLNLSSEKKLMAQIAFMNATYIVKSLVKDFKKEESSEEETPQTKS